MKQHTSLTAAGAFTALALVALPAMAQSSDSGGMQGALRGLLNGNQSQDTAVRNAYERGYQNGRQDEARMSNRSDRGAMRPSDERLGNNDSYSGRGDTYRRGGTSDTAPNSR